MKDKVKVGIIGTGRIAKIHISNLLSLKHMVEVKAVADVSEDAVNSFSQIYGIKEVYTDYKKMLCDEEIDAVIVTTPTNTHTTICSDIARAGKAIYCEKPIDVDSVKAKQLLDVIKETGVPFMVGFNRRFDHNYLRLHEMIEENQLGKLRTIKMTTRDYNIPPKEYNMVSGGMFVDAAIHDFDCLRYFAGCDVKEVYAVGKVCVAEGKIPEGDVDTSFVLFTFENGVIGCLEMDRETTFHADYRVEAFGTKGKALVDNEYENNVVFSGENGSIGNNPVLSWAERWKNSYLPCMEAFLNALKQEKAIPITGNDGWQANMITEAVNLSIRENRPVTVKEVEEKYF